MKRKIYFMIMLVTCLSIATPALVTPMFGDTHKPVNGGVYVGKDGNCYQDYEFERHFFWIGYDRVTKPVEVSCVQISERSLNEFRD